MIKRRKPCEFVLSGHPCLKARDHNGAHLVEVPQPAYFQGAYTLTMNRPINVIGGGIVPPRGVR